MDGFRALAHIQGHRCTLMSRNGHRFQILAAARKGRSRTPPAHSATLDGEICCLGGTTNFKASCSDGVRSS